MTPRHESEALEARLEELERNHEVVSDALRESRAQVQEMVEMQAGMQQRVRYLEAERGAPAGSEALSDTRPIRGATHVAGEYHTHWWVEHDDITRIEAYAEPGPYSLVPFIRVIADGEVLVRVPAYQCCLTYF